MFERSLKQSDRWFATGTEGFAPVFTDASFRASTAHFIAPAAVAANQNERLVEPLDVKTTPWSRTKQWLGSLSLHVLAVAATLVVTVWQADKAIPLENVTPVDIEFVTAQPIEPAPVPVQQVAYDDDLPEVQQNTAKVESAPPEPAPVVVSKKDNPKPEPQKSIKKQSQQPKPERVQQAQKPSAKAINTAAVAPKQVDETKSATPPSNYLGAVMARLQRNKLYPSAARERRETGKAVIRFTIAKGGNASGVVVVRSSGSATLDKEAHNVVHRSAPFPPLPETYSKNSLALTVPINFEMH